MGKANRQERADTLRKSEEAKLWVEQTQLSRLIIAAALFLFSFLTYLLTLSPSIRGGDSGELVTNAFLLGVNHPPGFPLHSLLGHLFTWLPVHSVAWRVNLLSAFCDALAAAFLGTTAMRASKNLGSGIVAGGLFAFSPLIWNFAVRTEVFALNNLFVSVLLWLSWHWITTREMRWLKWGALICGLGLSNHPSFLFFVIPFFVEALIYFRTQKNWAKTGLEVGLIFSLGFVPYIYIPLAAKKFLISSWGEADTFNGFLAHVLRRDYGTFRLMSQDKGEGGLVSGVIEYLIGLFRETLWVGPVVLVLLLPMFLRKTEKKNYFYFSLFSFLTYVVVFNALANLDLKEIVAKEIMSRFWQQADIFIFLWLGMVFSLISAYAVPLGVGVLLLQWGLHFHAEDQHQNRFISDYTRVTLESLAPHSVLLTQGDLQTDATLYLQGCEGIRPDVKLLDRMRITYGWAERVVHKNYPDLTIPGGPRAQYHRPHYDTVGYTLSDFLEANINKFPIYTGDMDPDEKDFPGKDRYKLYKYGWVNEFLPKPEKLSIDPYYASVRKTFDSIHPPLESPPEEFSYEFVLWKDYWEGLNQQGFPFLELGREAHDPKILNMGISFWEELTAKLPQPAALVYMNLGIALEEVAKYEPKARAKAISSFEKFLQLAPPEDPDVKKVRDELIRLKT